MVDLGEFYVVEKIIITKMSDFGGKHLIGAVVRVGNVAVAGRNMKCGPTISKTMVLLDYHIDIECSPAIVGRYVSIQTEKIGRRLSLCEVEVYTTVLEFPVIECPPRVSGIARGGASNAEVSWYSPILIDPFDRTFNVVCIPEMNSKFQLGSSNVTCVATAEDGTTLSCGFPVTVKATEFPVITCPTSLSAFAREGALTTEVGWWRPTVNDPFDRTFDVVCIPAPSSEFQLGSTNVTCVATARDGTAFSCGFPVTVKGLTCPSRAFAFSREGASTAEVSWDSPTVNDPFRAFDVACKPEKNSKFQLGSSNVTCIATAENSPTLSCGFSVTVKTCDNRLESNCYIFSKEKKSYYESRTACREIGADLVVIESLEENVYITSKMDFEFPKGTKAAFIGMNDVDAKGVWVWVNGDHVNSFTNWKNEKPDLNKHDCGTIQNGGKWDNAFCTSEMYFICEAKLKPLSLTCPNDIKLPIKRGTSGKTITYSAPLLNDADRFRPPPTITCSYPSGTFFPLGKTDVKCSAVLNQQKLASCSFRVKLKECKDEFLESCYIYVSEKRSFEKQVSICQEAGGSLVDIHSQEENDFLTKKFLGPRKYVYAGLRYRTNSGWKWENGQGIEDFKNWASSEPKEYTNGKSCLALKPSGKWKAYKCTTKHRTICELDIGG